jgi:hypothetical protein
MSDKGSDIFRKAMVILLKLAFFVVMVLIGYLIATSNWKDEVFYMTPNGKEALFLTLGAMFLLHLIRMFD